MTPSLNMKHDEPSTVVAAAYNTVYASTVDLAVDDVEVAETTDHTATCRVVDGVLHFGYDPSWWRRATEGQRVGLLCHELGHVEHEGHAPQFWEAVADAYDALRDSPDRVEAVLGGGVDWRAVREFLVSDPTTREVDPDVETAYERRLWLAERLDYDGTVEPFANARVIAPQRAGDEYDRVHISSISGTDATVDELLAYLDRDPHPDLRQATDRYVATRTPVVRESGRGYEVVRGRELLSLLHRSGHTKTTVRVVDE